jgi:hypothetical protein
MGKIDDSARLIIKTAYQKLGSKFDIANMYLIPQSVVDMYLLGVDQGTLWGRHVMRIEIARMQAEKEGKEFYKPVDKDKYKGGQPY